MKSKPTSAYLRFLHLAKAIKEVPLLPNLEPIEEKILEPHINYLTGTNMNIEYRDLLNNQKETL